MLLTGLYLRMRRGSVRRSPVTAASLFYNRMARLLARQGYHRSPQQTAEEFIAVISETELRTAVSEFTTAYQEARFGASTAVAQRLPGLLEAVRRAARAKSSPSQ